MRKSIYAIIACFLISAVAYCADVVLGKIGDITFTGSGTEFVAVFGGAPAPSGWADPNTYSGLWEMETTNALGNPLDTSGNNITLTNKPSYASGPAWTIVGTNQYSRIEHGYLFDNVDDYFDAGDINAMDGVSNMTISLWWYITETLGDYSLCALEKGTDNNNTIYIFNFGSVGAFDKNDLLLAIRDGGANYAGTTDSPIQTQVWQHIAFTFDGAGANNAAKFKVYVNGVQKSLTFSGTFPTKTDINASPLTIGTSTAAVPGVDFGGYMDQVTVVAGNGAEYSWSSNTVNTLYQNTHPTNNIRIRP